MSAQEFWSVIGDYNQNTLMIQIVLFVFAVFSIALSYTGVIKWLAKFALGVICLYIGIVFFGIYGKVPIQYFFAMPLYISCGILFIYESIRNKEDILEKPNLWQYILLTLYLLYPLISVFLGNSFPQIATYIMPCPMVSLSIVVYSGYKRKNKLLLILLTTWGLTGIKSVFFNAYEDLILLLCGIYGVVLIVNEFKLSFNSFSMQPKGKE